MSRPTQLNQKYIIVVVLVLENDQGDILLTQRKAKAHLAHYWEFPGGKVEPGETLLETLKRECIEEISYKPTKPSHILSIKHQYPTKLIQLEIYHEIKKSPVVSAVEEQHMQWVTKEQLSQLKTPEANSAIIDYLLK